MTVSLAFPPPAPRHYRLQPALVETGSIMLGVVLLIWSLLPVYDMFLIALDPEEGEIEFDGNLRPPEPSLEGFHDVLTHEARYLENFWHQFGNSQYIGLFTMALTVLIGSVVSFAVSRMRLGKRSYPVRAGRAQLI
jgi:multiple sugar transport system permease protein